MRVYVPKEWHCNRERWLMMLHYARCYPDWLKEINDIKLAYRAAGANSGGSASALSEVEQKVERMEHLSDKVNMMEQGCRDATETKPSLYNAQLTSVTENIPIDQVFTQITGRQLKKYRRKFFYQLDNMMQKKNII